MSIPNYQSVVADLARQYPAEWHAAHRGGPDTEAFIRRLAWVLHQQDRRVGLNGKRGNPNDLSDDCVCYDGVSEKGDVDPTRGNVPVTVIDVIGSAPRPGTSDPNGTPAWNAVGPATPRPHAAWVQPQPVGGEVPTPEPTPQPQPQPQPAPVCRYQPPDLSALDALDDTQRETLLAVQALQHEVAALRLEVQDARAALRNGLAVNGTIAGKASGGWTGDKAIAAVLSGVAAG